MTSHHQPRKIAPALAVLANSEGNLPYSGWGGGRRENQFCNHNPLLSARGRVFRINNKPQKVAGQFVDSRNSRTEGIAAAAVDHHGSFARHEISPSRRCNYAEHIVLVKRNVPKKILLKFDSCASPAALRRFLVRRDNATRPGALPVNCPAGASLFTYRADKRRYAANATARPTSAGRTYPMSKVSMRRIVHAAGMATIQ